MNSPKDNKQRSSYQKKEEYEEEMKRIERFLDGTLKKLEFAVTIPEILKNHYELVHISLSSPELYTIQRTFEMFIDTNKEVWSFSKPENEDFLKITSTKELEAFFNNYQTGKITPQRDDYNICAALYILYENKLMKDFTMNTTSISKDAFILLEDIKYLFYSFIKKMKYTPEEMILMEENLRKFYRKHDDLLDCFTLTKEETSKQNKKEIALKETKEEEISAWKNKIHNIKEECQEYIERLVEKTNKTIDLDWQCSIEKKEVLLEQIECDVTELENMRKEFVINEKELVIQKRQLEEQLHAILQQYDKDIQRRHNDYELVKENFEREKEQLIQLQEKYDEQTMSYDTLMAEKREYEEKLIEARMHELRRKMAARKIQRFYRKFRNFLLLHGKRGDGQKSKSKKKKK